MSRSKPIRIGIVGTGNAGKMQAGAVHRLRTEPELRAKYAAPFWQSAVCLANIEVAGVFDQSQDSLDAFGDMAKEWNLGERGLFWSFNDLDEFTKMHPPDNLDYIVISTPSGFHTEVAVELANRGYNLAVEKPIDITPGRGKDILNACKKKKVQIYGICQNLLAPDMIKARKLLQFGKMDNCFGKVKSVEARLMWYRTQEYYQGWRGTWGVDGGGVLMNQSIHTINAINSLVGAIQSVYAKAETRCHDIEVEDWIKLEAKAKGGIPVSFIGTTCDPGEDTLEIRIVGENGNVIVLTNYKINGRQSRLNGSPIESNEKTDTALLGKQVSGPLAQPPLHGLELYAIGKAMRGQDLRINFGRSDRAPIYAPLVNGSLAMHDLKTIMAAYQSVAIGSGVNVADISPDYAPDPELMKAALKGGN